MKDFLNRQLEIGDHVVMIREHYKELQLGQITGFTPSGEWARIQYGEHGKLTRRQQGHQLAKVEGPDLTWFILTK